MSLVQLARGLLTVLAFTALTAIVLTASLAQQAPPAPPPPEPVAPELVPLPVQAFGRDHPTCLEWSDNCVVCQRDDTGATHCSTAAIACLSEVVVCRREKP
jgi:hypothetical protein